LVKKNALKLTPGGRERGGRRGEGRWKNLVAAITTPPFPQRELGTSGCWTWD